MKVTSFVIDSFAKFLVGPAYRDVQGLVKAVDDPAKSGEEKRQAVIEGLETIGVALFGWLLNVAIELAVASLRAR